MKSISILFALAILSTSCSNGPTTIGIGPSKPPPPPPTQQGTAEPAPSAAPPAK